MRCSAPKVKRRLVNGAEFAYEHPCGYCFACRVRRRDEWTARILLECQDHRETVFTTLTYSDENLPSGGSLSEDDLSKWLKRLRKRIGPVRYFAAGEYGSKGGRPHYHAVMFGVHESQSRDIQSSWALGSTRTYPMSTAFARYVAKYTVKRSVSRRGCFDGRSPEFARMSRRPGVGYAGALRVAKALEGRHLRDKFSRLSDSEAKVTRITLPGVIRIGSRSYPMGRYLRSLVNERLGAPDGVTAARLCDEGLAFRGDAVPVMCDKILLLEQRTAKAVRRIQEKL